MTIHDPYAESQATTFQASAGRALKMWRAENALRSVQRPNENRGCGASIVGREAELSAVPQPAPQESTNGTRRESETSEEPADDTPYTHVSFFSESMTSESDRTLTRRHQPLPLPAGNVSVAAPMAGYSCQPWMKFLLVWLCMILVVALRGGDGHSIVSVRSCSWEYWAITAGGFFLLMLTSWRCGKCMSKAGFPKTIIKYTKLYIYTYICIYA